MITSAGRHVSCHVGHLDRDAPHDLDESNGEPVSCDTSFRGPVNTSDNRVEPSENCLSSHAPGMTEARATISWQREMLYSWYVVQKVLYKFNFVYEDIRTEKIQVRGKIIAGRDRRTSLVPFM